MTGFQPPPKMLMHFRAAGTARSQIRRTCRRIWRFFLRSPIAVPVRASTTHLYFSLHR